jgi:hypothetical protein
LSNIEGGGVSNSSGEDGVEEAAHPLSGPDERPLDVREPEAPVLLGVVQERDDLSQ